MTEILTIACVAAFVSTIVMHITRKNVTLIGLYALQSLSLATFLGVISWLESDRTLMLVAALTFLIKVVLAPYFFGGMIKRSRLFFAEGTHLGIPLSLAFILVLMFFSTKLLLPFVGVIPGESLLPLMLYPIMISGILVSLFFIVNHHDVLGQIVGILSLENWTMLTGVAIGIEQTLLLEIGISFDIAVWIAISLIFVSKLHQNFGNLRISHLTHLKED